MKFSWLCIAAFAWAVSPPSNAALGASGSWYNPSQSGHGLALDQLSQEAALMLWSTYDHDGNPMPLYSLGTFANGAFTGPAYAPHGSRFGDFDPEDLVMQPWGNVSFVPQNCSAGELGWDSPTFGMGGSLLRPLALLSCEGPGAPSLLKGVSGTWHHPQMHGMGVRVQVLDAQSALIYWYTNDRNGKPLPLYIEARIEGSRLTGSALAPRGMHFGTFSPSDLQVQPFGSVEINFQDCDSATLRYDTPLGKDQFALTRLTIPQEVECTLPESRPEWMATLYSGTSLQFTFPTRETVDAILLLNARNEVMLSTTGFQRLVRGQLRRDGDRTFMQVGAFGENYDKPIQHDPANGELFVRFIEPGEPGFGPFEVALRPAPTQPLLNPESALPGNFGDPTSLYGRQVIVGADHRLTLRQFWNGRLALEGSGRVTHIDSASGVFDFSIRVNAVGTSDYPGRDAWNNIRIFGSGALLRDSQGERLLLLGEGISQLPQPPAAEFVPEHLHWLLPRGAP